MFGFVSDSFFFFGFGSVSVLGLVLFGFGFQYCLCLTLFALVFWSRHMGWLYVRYHSNI